MATVNWNALEDSVLDGLFAADGMEIDVGERYELSEILGKGGQGTVYAAFDRQLNRQVAIKVAHNAQASRLLQAEAALLARLSHPAIPAVYDSGLGADGRAYMVMELVDGEPLYRLLRDPSSLTHRARLRIIRAVAGAVAHAHAQGILHRDCKPANIMIRKDGEPILIDWGLAATGDPRAICGTPSYAAPEQLSGQVADRRSDIYALGVLSYEVLSGKLPYARVVDDFEEFRRLRAGLGLIPLRKVCPHLSHAYQRLIDRAMAAQPAGRYTRCEEFCEDLDDVISGKNQTRRPWRWVAMVIIMSCSIGIGFWAGSTYGAATSQHSGGHFSDIATPNWGQPDSPVPERRLNDDVVEGEQVEVDRSMKESSGSNDDALPIEAVAAIRSPPQTTHRATGEGAETSDDSELVLGGNPSVILTDEDHNPDAEQVSADNPAPIITDEDLNHFGELFDLPELEDLLKEQVRAPASEAPQSESASGN